MGGSLLNVKQCDVEVLVNVLLFKLDRAAAQQSWGLHAEWVKSSWLRSLRAWCVHHRVQTPAAKPGT